MQRAPWVAPVLTAGMSLSQFSPMTSTRCPELSPAQLRLSLLQPVSSCRQALSLKVLGGLFLAHGLPFGPKMEHLEQTNNHSNSCSFTPLQFQRGSLTPNSVPLDLSVSCSSSTCPPPCYNSKGKTCIQSPRPQLFPKNLCNSPCSTLRRLPTAAGHAD